MFRNIQLSCFWPRLCHMKCQTLSRAYCRYRLFEREIICKRDEPLTEGLFFLWLHLNCAGPKYMII